jgi:hypothetical protein
MNVFLWHVHGSWTTAFVQGPHRYYFPVVPGRGPEGRGRAQTWEWPASAIEVTPDESKDLDLDVLIVQDHEELSLASRWLRRRPGRDLRTIFVEHNAPQGRVGEMRHPVAHRSDIGLVHVTHFNRLFWDSGEAPTRVIEHGIVDPGYRYTGLNESAAVVINEPVRRGRVTGTDLLEIFSRSIVLELYGMGVRPLGGHEDLSQEELHDRMPDHRIYLHPNRWTSLGLSLIEAMHLGMPVVALATTEVPTLVSEETGIVGTDVERLAAEAARLMVDHERCRAMGKAGRRSALERFGLERFLAEWDDVLAGGWP